MALFRKSTGMGPAPLDGVDVVLADLDGVVYRGPNPVPHAVESLNALAPAGIRSGGGSATSRTTPPGLTNRLLSTCATSDSR